jgi:hypothetical protein
MPWPHLGFLVSHGVEHVNLDDQSQNTFWPEAPAQGNDHHVHQPPVDHHAPSSFEDFLGSADTTTPEIYPFVVACGIAACTFVGTLGTVFHLASETARRKYERPGENVAFTAKASGEEASTASGRSEHGGGDESDDEPLL